MKICQKYELVFLFHLNVTFHECFSIFESSFLKRSYRNTVSAIYKKNGLLHHNCRSMNRNIVCFKFEAQESCFNYEIRFCIIVKLLLSIVVIFVVLTPFFFGNVVRFALCQTILQYVSHTAILIYYIMHLFKNISNCISFLSFVINCRLAVQLKRKILYFVISTKYLDMSC